MNVITGECSNCSVFSRCEFLFSRRGSGKRPKASIRSRLGKSGADAPIDTNRCRLNRRDLLTV